MEARVIKMRYIGCELSRYIAKALRPFCLLFKRVHRQQVVFFNLFLPIFYEWIQFWKPWSKHKQKGESSRRKEIENFSTDKSLGPKLGKVINTLLSVKLTSIDSKRAFSICRNIMRFNRMRLSSKKLDLFMFVNENIKKFEQN